jgi:hypothetical protein
LYLYMYLWWAWIWGSCQIIFVWVYFETSKGQMVKKRRTQCQKFIFPKQTGKCRFDLPTTSPNKCCVAPTDSLSICY